MVNEDEDEDNRDSLNNGVIEKKVIFMVNVIKFKKKKNKGKNKGKILIFVVLEINFVVEEFVDELLE